SGETAPAERTPHDSTDAFFQAERHQLPFVLAADERVVRLVGDMARIAVAVGHGQCLHEMPAREVGNASVSDLAGAHERVERGERLLLRCQRVVGMKLEEIDVIGLQALELLLYRADEVSPGRADVIGLIVEAEGCLGGDDAPIALAFYRLSENAL